MFWRLNTFSIWIGAAGEAPKKGEVDAYQYEKLALQLGDRLREVEVQIPYWDHLSGGRAYWAKIVAGTQALVRKGCIVRLKLLQVRYFKYYTLDVELKDEEVAMEGVDKCFRWRDNDAHLFNVIPRDHPEAIVRKKLRSFVMSLVR